MCSPRSASRVVGVDANPEAYEHARLRYVGPNLSFAADLVDGYSEPAEAVVFLQTIEHIEDPGATLEHFRSIVGESGTVFLSTPNVLTLAPEGRGALGQPLARPRVPPRGIPGAVRGALRAGRALRPLPRPQTPRPPDRAEPRLGQGPCAPFI